MIKTVQFRRLFPLGTLALGTPSSSRAADKFKAGPSQGSTDFPLAILAIQRLALPLAATDNPPS